MASTTELLSQALGLSDTERARLVRGLLQSLDPPGSIDDGTASPLASLLQQRLRRLEAGEGTLTDADDAIAQLETAHRLRLLENPG